MTVQKAKTIDLKSLNQVTKVDIPGTSASSSSQKANLDKAATDKKKSLFGNKH